MIGPCPDTRIWRTHVGRLMSPWDTSMAAYEKHNALAGSEAQQEHWKREASPHDRNRCTNLFAEAIYRHGANEYHETYLSWKSIIWLQNILGEEENTIYVHTGRQQPVLQGV